MQRIKSLTLFLYQHHFVRYALVGGSTFIIDFGILFSLHGKFGLNLAASASVAYWSAIFYNFALNRYWTFDSREKESLKHHITAYFGLLVFNYLFTVTFVSIVGTYVNYVLAKVMSVIIQITWTYIIYKKYIFVKTKEA